MITIGRMILNASPAEVINDLKVECLERGLPYFNSTKEGPTNFQFTCPFHAGGQERKPSCGMSKQRVVRGSKVYEEGTVHCFTCGYSSDLPHFIGDVLSAPNPESFGKSWLRRRYGGEEVDFRPTMDLGLDRGRSSKPSPPQREYVSEQELESYRWVHPYMQKRKLTSDSIHMFDIGYDKLSDAITIPVRDTEGRTVFIQRRSTGQKFHNYGANDPKGEYLYGQYELSKYPEYYDPRAPLYVTESALNAIMLWQKGLPAVALMGVGSTVQMELLRKIGFRHIILALDPDDAGQKASQKIRDAVGDKKLVSFLQYPPEYYENGWDINDNPDGINYFNFYS